MLRFAARAKPRVHPTWKTRRVLIALDSLNTARGCGVQEQGWNASGELGYSSDRKTLHANCECSLSDHCLFFTFCDLPGARDTGLEDANDGQCASAGSACGSGCDPSGCTDSTYGVEPSAAFARRGTTDARRAACREVEARVGARRGKHRYQLDRGGSAAACARTAEGRRCRAGNTEQGAAGVAAHRCALRRAAARGGSGAHGGPGRPGKSVAERFGQSGEGAVGAGRQHGTKRGVAGEAACRLAGDGTETGGVQMCGASASAGVPEAAGEKARA